MISVRLGVLREHIRAQMQDSQAGLSGVIPGDESLQKRSVGSGNFPFPFVADLGF